MRIMPLAIDNIVCPYCQAKLIRRKDMLICRYHRKGFAIQEKALDLRWDWAKPVSEKEWKSSSSPT